MNRISRFLLPVFVFAALAVSLVGVAFARELTGEDPRPAAGDRSFSGEIEFYGPLDSVEGPTWTVNGIAFTVSPQTEVEGAPVVGSFVKVHASLNAAGMLVAREIEPAAPGQIRIDDHSNDDGLVDDMDDSYSDDDSYDDDDSYNDDDSNGDDDSNDDDDDGSGDDDDNGDDDEDDDSGRDG